VLQAQVQETKLLRDVTMHHLEAGKVQTRLKQLLNRPQSSPDIEAASLAETPLDTTFDQLLSALQAQNPDLAATQNTIAREKVRVSHSMKLATSSLPIPMMVSFEKLLMAGSSAR
jgi:outer membrane protein TolC